MIDASTIAAPTNAPPLPTGHFSLPLGDPQETNQDCLANPSQLKAWACDVQPPPLFIDTQIASDGCPSAQIYPPSPQASSIQYGPQPPIVSPFLQLEFVVDLSDPQLGAALHFQDVYNKLVILDPSALSTSTKKRRQYPGPGPGPGPLPGGGIHHRKNTVQAGDLPWFCFWNGTSIEGFIYVEQHITNSSNSATTSQTGNSSPQSTSSTNNNQNSPTATQTTFMTSAVTEMASHFSGSKSMTSSPAARRQARDNHRGDDHKGNNNKNGKGMHQNDADNTQQFPFWVKLSERRLRNIAQRPYCQKMTVASDGSVSTFLQDGAPVKVWLDEVDPSDGAFESAAALPVSSPVAVASSTAVSDAVKRAVQEGFGADGDWAVQERALEDRMAEAAVEEWRGYDDELAAVVEYWKREDPAKSCACQWLVT